MSVVEISALKDGMSLSNAIMYIQSYKKALKKDGKSFYISGVFMKQDATIPFKVWDTSLVEAMSQNDLSGNVVKIQGTVGSYMNNVEIKINAIEPVNSVEYPKSIFLRSADVDSLFKEFTQFMQSEISPQGVNILSFIFKQENILGRFKEEFAGSLMHDALIGGLMHHTVKMLRLAKCVFENEPRMKLLENYKDMLYISVILHDIGKVKEMNLGVYQVNSFVTHRILGIEMLVKYKKLFVEAYDENFYYEVLSVLQGHHGEFGDYPTTVLAYIVHLIDMLDSQTTGIFDKIERNDYTTRAGDMSVYVNNHYLAV